MDEVVIYLNKNHLKPNEVVYILFEYCNRYIKPSYNNYKNFCGELNQCAIELERRLGYEYTPILLDLALFVDECRLDLCNDKIVFMKNSDIKVNGDLNYILYKYCKTYNYSGFNILLRKAAKKITSEILGTYEFTKMMENGDI